MKLDVPDLPVGKGDFLYNTDMTQWREENAVEGETIHVGCCATRNAAFC
jgi:hypothetical protein